MNSTIYSAIVFDMDGVIFDSERAALGCWIETAVNYGIAGIQEVFHECLGTSDSVTKDILLSHYSDNFPADSFLEDSSILYHKKYDGGKLPKKTGIHELLDMLTQANKKIALATSSRSETAINQLKAAGLYDYFDVIICGDMIKDSKPAPDIYKKACELLEVEPNTAYAIEDSFNGIRSAYRAGLKPIMVPDILQPSDEIKEKATIILKDLHEVLRYLRN